MSLTFGFYNSVSGDRQYDATQMSSLFDGIINDGVFASIGSKFIATATSGMAAKVGTGRAWFFHTWTNNDAEIPVIFETSEVILNRIDAIVLEINASNEVRENSIKVIKGIPASFPTNPALTNTASIKQYSICYVSIPAGVTEITQAMITNMVGSSACPFVTGILDTVNVDELLLQWTDQFQTWFASIADILDENAAGNLLNLINGLITKGNTTLPNTGWVANVGDNLFKRNLPIAGVIVGNWVDVTIDKDYQDVANDAEINPTVDEYAGGITFYANKVPTADIPIRYKVVK